MKKSYKTFLIIFLLCFLPFNLLAMDNEQTPFLLDSGAYTIQGLNPRKIENEDRFLSEWINYNHVPTCIACVFDGHGGSDVSHYLQENFPRMLCNNGFDPDIALRESFISADDQVKNITRQGATALVAMILPYKKPLLIIANAGDSRAIWLENQVIKTTRDHKPQDDLEVERIKNAGGVIFKDGNIFRVYGKTKLSVARSLGDYQADHSKDSGLSCIPDIYKIELTCAIKFIILASDGVFDTVDNNQAYELVRSIFEQGGSSHAAARYLVELAKLKGSRDDLTAIVIRLWWK